MRTIPREVFRSLKSKFLLNHTQTSVLVGTILGDGSVQMRKLDARLHIKHSLKQLSLVKYKRDIFSNITSMQVREFKQNIGKVSYNFAEFVTLTHPEFTRFYKTFYTSKNKIVPKNIKDLLDPLSLAVWIMDDGAAEYLGLSIQTHSFSQEDVNILLRAIIEKFGIEVIKRKNKGRWIVYFPKNSLQKLETTVGKHVLPEFKYKFIPYIQRIKTP